MACLKDTIVYGDILLYNSVSDETAGIPAASLLKSGEMNIDKGLSVKIYITGNFALDSSSLVATIPANFNYSENGYKISQKSTDDPFSIKGDSTAICSKLSTNNTITADSMKIGTEVSRNSQHINTTDFYTYYTANLNGGVKIYNNGNVVFNIPTLSSERAIATKSIVLNTTSSSDGKITILPESITASSGDGNTSVLIDPLGITFTKSGSSKRITANDAYMSHVRTINSSSTALTIYNSKAEVNGLTGKPLLIVSGSQPITIRPEVVSKSTGGLGSTATTYFYTEITLYGTFVLSNVVASAVKDIDNAVTSGILDYTVNGVSKSISFTNSDTVSSLISSTERVYIKYNSSAATNEVNVYDIV